MSTRVRINGTEYIIAGIGGEVMPIGTIVDYVGSDIPDGWAQYTGTDSNYAYSSHAYTLKLTSNINAGATVNLPCTYLVGAGVMDVYLNGEKLICTDSSDTAGTNGHYIELGNANSISSTIKTTNDWSLASGDTLELIVRGIY